MVEIILFLLVIGAYYAIHRHSKNDKAHKGDLGGAGGGAGGGAPPVKQK